MKNAQSIQEEKAKSNKFVRSNDVGLRVSKDSESLRKVDKGCTEIGGDRIRELEKEVVAFRITNRGKDYFIEQLKKERGVFGVRRETHEHQSESRRAGDKTASIAGARTQTKQES
jgi:hypothetical protein